VAKGSLLHDTNARNDEKIVVLRQQLGSEGYGNYWMLNEIMRTATENKLSLSRTSAYAFSCAVPVTQFEQVIKCAIDLELYQSDGVFFWSKRLVQDAAAYKQTCETNAENGRKGGCGKRALSERKADAKRRPSGPLYSPPLDSIPVSEIGGESREGEPIRLAERIKVSPAEHAELLSEFSSDSVTYYAPIASDWLKANGKTKKNYASFLRNWIRKEIAERKGFYHPSRFQNGDGPKRFETSLEVKNRLEAEARQRFLNRGTRQ